MTICIQCTLERFVASDGKDQTPYSTDEQTWEHMRRFHSNPVATQERREYLNREAERIMNRLTHEAEQAAERN